MPQMTKEEKKLYDKQYREKNKEKRQLQHKKWCENNKEKMALYQKKYNDKNKEKKKEYDKDYQENKKTENPLDYKLKQMIISSKQNDILYNRYDEEYHITYDFLQEQHTKQNNKCGYCLIDMELTFENNKNPNKITLERKDNTLGHIKSNCIFSCWKCNITTRNKPLECKL